MLGGPALGPRDVPVLEDEGGTGRADRVHRRLDDRLERLLQVEGFGHRLGDARQCLQLADPALRLAQSLACSIVCATWAAIASSSSISSSVNSRGSIVRTFNAPANFSRARIRTARIDSYWSSGRFRKPLKRGSRCAWAAIAMSRRSAARCR